jgi:hypothetical protein
VVAVVPAQAGIHCLSAMSFLANVGEGNDNVGPSFRWDDVADNLRILTVTDLPSFQRTLESVACQ